MLGCVTSKSWSNTWVRVCTRERGSGLHLGCGRLAQLVELNKRERELWSKSKELRKIEYHLCIRKKPYIQGREKRFANFANLQPGRARQRS